MIAFERFMARLDDRWVLKGGYALQLRTDSARSTQDIDLLVQHLTSEQIFEVLLQQVHQDVGDYFEFYVERAGQEFNIKDVFRFRVTSRLAGRVFERFHVDVGIIDPIVEPIEYIAPPQHLTFSGLTTPLVPCYSVSQHIAEKLHALVRPRSVETSRIKDLVDILLLASMDTVLYAERLYAAIKLIFEARGDTIPTKLDQIPESWNLKFNQFTRKLDLPFSDFDGAVGKAKFFINPILGGLQNGIWDSKGWEWKGEPE